MAEKKTMIDQYLSIKNQHKDSILMFQVGGFYQLYYHDAKIVSKVMGTKMVSRAIGSGKHAPMCGVPVTSGKTYAKTLADNGYRVFLCNQTEEKDSCGLAIRKITETIEPEQNVIDLSAKWDEFINSEDIYDLIPPKKNNQKNSIKTEEKTLVQRLACLDLSFMTPVQAFRIIQEWKEIYAD